jgi:hypothetical protein
MCVTVAWLRDELSAKCGQGMLRRPCSSTISGSVETVLQVVRQSPRSLYGSVVVRLVYVKLMFIKNCRVRRWIG